MHLSETEAFGQSYANPNRNRLETEDRPFHDWYRFVLSFPPHLVRQYVASEFHLKKGDVVLDPFCGTGTTPIEAQLLGFQAAGFEANPMAHFASSVKTDWSIVPDGLGAWAQRIAQQAFAKLRAQRKQRTLSDEEYRLLLTDSICPVPLNKLLILREAINDANEPRFQNIGLLALAKAAVQTASNLHFGPEVGVRGRKLDAPVIEAWLSNVDTMNRDLENAASHQKANIYCTDARYMNSVIEANSIQAVFTSPPYPNEKDYTRTTRLESVLLGFLTSKTDLRALKNNLVRSNTRNVFKADDDDRWIDSYDRINDIANRIEERRIELEKTSGFEKLYARVTRLYFGGMAKHLEALRPVLKSGSMLGYVVGDQASYLRIHIPTGELLVEIAKNLGFRHIRTDLFRTRLATATKTQMREEVVILRWEG